MDKITKALQKLSEKEKIVIKNIFLKIKNNSLDGFNLKKLKNSDSIFRIRKGKFRIIFKINKLNKIDILSLERRSDKTYNKY